ncbi:hypothetical protein BJ684DRAFT_18558, partial [Piptocephalis cylindrospora]
RDALRRQGLPHVLRLAVPRPGLQLTEHPSSAAASSILLEDVVRGSIPFKVSTVDDAILLKSDGMPTYHLASVVDDHLMRISHVLRGEEWLSSAPKHLLLYKAFGWTPPAFVHLPLLQNEQGRKLSKRQGDLDVASFRDRGLMPEAVLNFIAMLGWNPGTTQEVFTVSELIDQFSLQGINVSSGMVRPEKLRWLGQQHLLLGTPSPTSASPSLIQDLSKRISNSFPDLTQPSQDYLTRVLYASRERIRTVSDIPDRFPFFFLAPLGQSKEAAKFLSSSSIPRESMVKMIMAALEEVGRSDEMDTAGANDILESVCTFGSWELNDIRKTLRYALMDSKTGPGVAMVMSVLGKKESEDRLRAATNRLQASA